MTAPNQKRVRPGAAVEIAGGRALDFHALCLAFPAMPADEFEALKADVKRAGGIRDHGWLYEGKILEGRHRYQVARALRLPMRFKTFAGRDPVAFVVSCNMRRRHLDESQRAMIAARLEGFRHGGKRGANSPDCPVLTRREAARIAGASARSVTRAAVVRDKGAPELIAAVDSKVVPVAVAALVASAASKQEQAALIALGEKGIMAAAKELRARKQATNHAARQDKLEKIAAKNPDLPNGRRYSVVLIDIPRKHNVYSDQSGSERAPENHYPTMDFAQTLDFAIDRFAAKDCVIAFWSTAASLVDDIEILADWGFVSLRPRGADGKILRDKAGAPLPPIGRGQYGSLQIWRKVRVGKAMGLGRWFRDQHEQIIFARRGDVPAPLPGKQDESVFDAPIGVHSEKPGERTRAMISRIWPGLTKIEVFGRGKAPKGWVFWGNQATAEALQAVKAEGRRPRQIDLEEAIAAKGKRAAA
jgi:N6-adenosine-specific RNA methylase IME4